MDISDSLKTLEITDKKQLKKFYKLWSISLSSKIKKYAQDHSLSWYNTKWRNKSKEIPFYIKPNSRNAGGEVWFASSPVNYAFGKGIQKLPDKYKKFPKSIKPKPYRSGGKWYTPVKFKSDIKNIDTSITNVSGFDRFFTSRTSHHKTRKYKRPMLWGQELSTGQILPILLKEQMSDYVINDPKLNDLVMDSFNEVVESKKYL